ncbi:MAG TPA: HAD hydrolase-like protein, partial [Fibrobacteraceae bacterium]|nr:HAD hydrolase-like protein [Fibrobacteraceae bacterium]
MPHSPSFHLEWVELPQRYPALLFDGFGTLYNLMDAHRGAVELLDRLRHTGCSLRLVTNAASRRPERLRDHLGAMGLGFSVNEIVSSGSLLAEVNRKLGIHSALHLGREEAQFFLQEAGIHAEEPMTRPCVVMTSALSESDPRLDRARYWLARPGALLVNLNPDAWAPRRDGTRIPVSGSQAWGLRRETGCRLLCLGKPFGGIFRRALASLPSPQGPVLMVGDTLGTDILG